MKCCDMKAGMLKHVVSFERPAKTRDGGGRYCVRRAIMQLDFSSLAKMEAG